MNAPQLSGEAHAVIEPPVAEASGSCAVVRLSFGPQGHVVPTDDGTGLVLMVTRGPVGPFTEPLVYVRITFGPDLKPIIEKVNIEGRY